MAIICPAILASDSKEYHHQIKKVGSFARRIQVDIMDGQFVESQSINLVQADWPESIKADIHLMVKRPAEHFETLVALRPNLVIIHAEAEGNLKQLLKDLKDYQIKVGLALLPETEISSASELMASVDHLLIFGGHLGHMGGRADLSQLAKVTEARRLYPELEIGWDGGVSSDNIAQLSQAGVDVFNVGGYIQSASDPKKAYDLLTSLL